MREGLTEGACVRLRVGFKLGDGLGGVVLHFVGEAEVVVELREAGVELDGGLELSFGVGELVELDEGGGEVLMGGDAGWDAFGGEGDGVLEDGNGVFGVLGLGEGHAEVGGGEGVVGLGGEDLAEEGDGLGRVAGALEGEGEGESGVGGGGVCGIWVGGEKLLEDRDGFGVIAGGGEGFGDFEEDEGVVGCDLLGLLELGESAWEVLCFERESEMEVRGGGLGVEMEGGGELLLSVGPEVLLGVEGAEVVVELGVLGIGGEGGFHPGGGLREVAGGGEGVGVGGEDGGAEGVVLEVGCGLKLGEEREGFGGLVELLEGDGEVELGAGVGVVEGEGELELVDGLGEMAGVDEDEAEGGVAGFGVGGEAGDLLEVGLCGGEVVAGEGGGAGAVDGVGLLEGLRGGERRQEDGGEEEAAAVGGSWRHAAVGDGGGIQHR